MNFNHRVCEFLFRFLMRWEGRVAITLRGQIFKILTGQSCNDLLIGPDVFISGMKNISLGRSISIHRGSFISAEGGLSIGSDVSIAHHCSIHTTEHIFELRNVPIRKQGLKYRSVTIGNNVWIGANVTILSGSIIGDNTVVAAGSVVVGDFSRGSVLIGGVPARLIKELFRGG